MNLYLIYLYSFNFKNNQNQTFKSQEILLKLNKRYQNKNEFWLLKPDKQTEANKQLQKLKK